MTSNLIVDRWRRRKHEQGEELTHEPASPSPRYEDDAAVAKIFAELKPRDRALLWLAYVEGESHEEIATSLGVGRRGVKVMLFARAAAAARPDAGTRAAGELMTEWFDLDREEERAVLPRSWRG